MQVPLGHYDTAISGQHILTTTIATADNFGVCALCAPAAGDTLVVAAGVSVRSTDFATIDIQGGARLQVFGMVYQNENRE